MPQWRSGGFSAVSSVRVTTAEDAVAAALRALSRRVCRATAANRYSSRSHVLLCLSVNHPVSRSKCKEPTEVGSVVHLLGVLRRPPAPA